MNLDTNGMMISLFSGQKNNRIIILLCHIKIKCKSSTHNTLDKKKPITHKRQRTRERGWGVQPNRGKCQTGRREKGGRKGRKVSWSFHRIWGSK